VRLDDVRRERPKRTAKLAHKADVEAGAKWHHIVRNPGILQELSIWRLRRCDMLEDDNPHVDALGGERWDQGRKLTPGPTHGRRVHQRRNAHGAA
jgi:hypothetical protein